MSLGVECRVVDTLTSPIVLGIDWLTRYSPRIDWSNYAIELDTSVSTIVLTGVTLADGSTFRSSKCVLIPLELGG